MKTLLVLSPHLDDAAFSVSPLLAVLGESDRMVVATPFAGSVTEPRGFALACQLDKGLPPEIDYMALRREEDKEWARGIGVQIVHGDLKEAPHRSYHSASELFSGIHPDDPIEPDLTAWLRGVSDDHPPEMILLPLGIGGHVDHLWLRRTTEAIFSGKVPLGYYSDQPYCAKQSLMPGECGFPETEGLVAIKFKPDLGDLHRSLDATSAYVSQIPFQFGNFQKMRHLLETVWRDSTCVFSSKADIQILEESNLVKPT